MEFDPSLCDCGARAHRLARDIHHLRSPVGSNVRKAIHRSAADGDHFAVRLVIVSEIVLCRFAFDNAEKELPKLLITRASPQRFHNIELKRATEARTQFPITCEAKFVAAFAEMQIRHRPDEANALFPTGDLIVGGWTVR